MSLRPHSRDARQGLPALAAHAGIKIGSTWWTTAAAVAVTLLWPALAQAQRPLPTEEGRLRGAPSREVTYAELPTGSGQILVVNPRYHMLLEFPANVSLTSVRNPKMVTTEIVDGNKVFLLPLRFGGETSMQIFLDDDRGTTIPYIVRLDTLANPVLTLHYNDPIEKHVRAVEAETRAREAARFDERVLAASEGLLRQRLLRGLSTYRLEDVEQGRQTNRFGESVMVELVDLTITDENSQNPRAYLKYRVANLTNKPLRGLAPKATLRFSPKNGERPGGLLQQLGELEDRRSRRTVPPGRYIEGLLIFDDPGLRRKDRIEVQFEHPDGIRVRTIGTLTGR